MGVEEIVVEHARGTARVSPIGATVLGFKPAEGPELLWVSPKARFEVGAAIRGGIPVCWPWFANEGGPPAHGVARTRLWSVAAARSDADATELVFALEDDASTRAVWPHRFRFLLTVRVGDALTVSLSHENLDAAAVRCTGALHAYFAVSDARRSSVTGLEGPFFDKVAGVAGTQVGPARFDGETDRVFACGPGALTLRDGERAVRLTRGGSRTAVLWNPGPAKAAAMDDLRTAEGFVCVEAANAGSDAVTIPPGGTHSLSLSIEPER